MQQQRQDSASTGPTVRWSRDAPILPAARTMIQRRSFMRKWRPIPAAEVTRSRPYGDTPQKHGHLGVSQHSYGPGKPCTMMIRLPDELGETLRRAGYWKSIKAIEGLRAWADEWGQRSRGRRARGCARRRPARPGRAGRHGREARARRGPGRARGSAQEGHHHRGHPARRGQDGPRRGHPHAEACSGQGAAASGDFDHELAARIQFSRIWSTADWMAAAGQPK